MIFLAFAESIQLVPDGTLFLHIAIILIMIYILNRTLFRPINRILEERERSTHGRAGEARGILQQVDESLARYEQTLRDARGDGYRLLEQRRTEAMSSRQNKIDVVKDEVSNLLQKQKDSIHVQAEESRVILESEARRVAGIVSTQILGRPTNESSGI